MPPPLDREAGGRRRHLSRAPAQSPADAQLFTLPHGVRALVIHHPWRQLVSLSVFVRTGSQHESRGLNGIGHVVEHMAFKGTHTRDCQRINLDAKLLGGGNSNTFFLAVDPPPYGR